MPLVYRELRRRAGAYLRNERPRSHAAADGSGPRSVRPPGRAGPSQLAEPCAVFRRGRADDAAHPGRSRATASRGEAPRRWRRKSRWTIASARPGPHDCEILLLDQALGELATVDARQAGIVELRYFGGLTEDEVAALLTLSRATVTREWQAARTWLYRRMTRRQRREEQPKVKSESGRRAGGPARFSRKWTSRTPRFEVWAVDLIGKSIGVYQITCAAGCRRDG